jgi:hypothetical protein
LNNRHLLSNQDSSNSCFSIVSKLILLFPRRIPATTSRDIVVDLVVNSDEFGSSTAHTHITNFLLHTRYLIDIADSDGAVAQVCSDYLADFLVCLARN